MLFAKLVQIVTETYKIARKSFQINEPCGTSLFRQQSIDSRLTSCLK